MTDEVWEDATLIAIARSNTPRTIRAGTVAMNIASLPSGLVQWEQQVLALGIQKSERPIVTQSEMAVHDIQQPPRASTLLAMLFRDGEVTLRVMLILTDAVQARSGWI